MRHVVTDCPEAILLMVGDGNERSALEASVQRQGLSENVVFAGAQTDVWNIFPACDIYLTMAGGSNVGVAALEAMACARPVLAYNTAPMLEEWAFCEEHGVFLATANPVTLANKVVLLLNQPARARELGSRARQQVVQLHSQEAMAARYCELYRQVLADDRSAEGRR